MPRKAIERSSHLRHAVNLGFQSSSRKHWRRPRRAYPSIEPRVEQPVRKLFSFSAALRIAAQILFGFGSVLAIATIPAVMDRGITESHGPPSMTLCATLLGFAAGFRAPRRIAARVLQAVRNHAIASPLRSDARTSSAGEVDDATLRRLTTSVLFFLSGLAVVSLPVSVSIANLLDILLHRHFVFPTPLLIIAQLIVSMVVLGPQMVVLGAAAIGIHRRDGARHVHVGAFAWSLAGGVGALLLAYLASSRPEGALAMASLPLFLAAILTSSVSGKRQTARRPVARRNRKQNSYRLW